MMMRVPYYVLQWQRRKVHTVTREDLQWWLDLAPTLEWIWAKTYADTAPHHYVVLGRTPGMTKADFERAGRVIRQFGQPGKFYSSTNIYLTSPDGKTKWWIMPEQGKDIAYNSTLINMASTDTTYGKQDAMTTTSKHESVYDGLAVDYDAMWTKPEDLAENAEVQRLIVQCFKAYAPRTLDVGCGTGLLLDLKVTHPSRYVGFDPSQGMLNEFVVKHPTAQVEAATADEWLELHNPKPGDFELLTCLFATTSYLEPDTIRRLAEIPSRQAIFMNYDGKWLPDWYHGEAPPTLDAARKATADLLEDYNGTAMTIGNFDTVVLYK